MRQAKPTFKLSAVLLACGALLSACGGGGPADEGAMQQSISFDYPGGPIMSVLPSVTTINLKATADSGLPVTFSSDTPTICTVSGSTLTLIAGGECKVTASQAGGNGYAATSTSQLFVVSKYPQALGMLNPGWQPLDTTPVEVVAASSLNKPITFTSQTPTVCTVGAPTVTTLADGSSASSASVSKLANGMCIITASEPGAVDYAAASVTKNIPIGTAMAPLLTFASGYQTGGAVETIGGSGLTTIADATKEHATVGQLFNGAFGGWGWNNSMMSYSVDPLGASFTSTLVADKSAIDAVRGSWEIGSTTTGIIVMAPGLAGLSASGSTAGIQVDAQAALNINIAENVEWFQSTSENKLSVDLTLGNQVKKADGSFCNPVLRGVITPTSAAATNYSLPLKDLSVQEACELTVTQAGVWTLLQLSSIARVKISPNSTINSTVADADGTKYTTTITVGAITLQ